MLTSKLEGKRKIYKANPKHPLYNAITTFVHNTVGIDQIVEQVAGRIGDLEKAYVTGSFATGIDSDIMELALVGKDVNTEYIEKLVKKAEKRIGREIMYLVLTPEQMKYYFNEKPTLLIWEKDKSE